MPKQKIKFWPCSKYTSWNEIPCELLLPNVITSFSVACSNICSLQTHLKFFFTAVFSENYFLCLSGGYSDTWAKPVGGTFYSDTLILHLLRQGESLCRVGRVGNCLSVEWLSPGHVRNHCEWHASLQAQCYSVK